MSKEAIDMYQVKVTAKHDPEDCQVLFGIVRRFGDDAKAEWAKGNLTVEEAVTGETFLVDMDEFDVEDMGFGDWKNRDEETGMCIDTEFDRYVNDSFKEHMRKSDAAGEGLKKHKLFDVPVADGRAYYVVTSVGKKNVKIEWRGFCPDRWYDQILGGGGSFPRHCIEPQIRSGEALKRIFRSIKS